MANIGLLSEITAFSIHIFDYCSEVFVQFTLITLLTIKNAARACAPAAYVYGLLLLTFISFLPIILLLRHW